MRKRIVRVLLPMVLLLVMLCIPASAADYEGHPIVIGGTTYDAGYKTVTVRNADARELTEKLPQFPALETVYLLDTLPEADALIALKESFPNILFVWEFSLYGITTDTRAEFLDLSGIRIADTAELVAALPFFYNLKQVDMVDCGISNEDMEALNQDHPGTKFVWALQIRGIKLRTDATSFMPGRYGGRVYDSDCALLRYCHDLVCIDLGHMPITDCSFLYGTPHVKYLILADASLQDISPIGTLTELVFLEIFNMGIVDYWPLTNCTSLKDLNISYTTFLDCTPLYQMTWLERLMMVGSGFDWDEQAQFRTQFPLTHIVFESHSATDKGWRFSPNYYAMRDMLGMYYMIL